MIAALQTVGGQNIQQFIEIKRLLRHRKLQHIIIADAHADRDLAQTLHRLFPKNFRIVHIRDIRKLRQRLREEIIRLFLIRLHPLPLFDLKAILPEKMLDLMLGERVTHDDALLLRREVRLQQRIEIVARIMVFEPCRDAVLIIIDEHLRQQRQDLKALQEGRCHMHLRDLLELRQQPAKEIPHRSRRNLQMARGPESLHERLEAPGEIRLHLVDGILYQHIAAGHIERNHALCREGNAPALLTFLHLD